MALVKAEKSGIADSGLQQLIEIAPEGVTIHQDRRIVYANQAAAEQYGANDPEEILGRDGYDFVAPADRGRIAARIQQLYDDGVGGRALLTRFRRLCLDGRVVDVETVATTILWEERPAVLSFVRDVTARLTAEERVQKLLSTGAHSLWETDAEHRFTSLSTGFTRSGFTQAHVLGKTRWELASALPDDPPWRDHIADLDARRPFHDFKYRNVGPNGKKVCGAVSGTPIFDVHGTFQGYQGISTDITERFLAEQVMRESEERFKLALEGASGGVFDIDLVSGEIAYDQQSARMLGYDRADEVPRRLTDWMERLHPDDREAARTRLDDLLEGKTELLRSEQRQRTRSGTWLWFNCIGKVVERGDDGRPTRLVGLRFDITERKQAEQTIAHMALHDDLTKLPNRVYFADELERACRAAKRDGTKLAVLFLDLDHFKDINDTLGHSVGDKLLIEVASRLKSCLRGGDLVARFGGDEFVMVVTHSCDPSMIRYLADRITKKIAEPYDIDGLTVHTGISIGIAIYPDDGADTERILANADLALTALRERGVSIAIDDFGMGYSSMARLKTLPVDILKIDRSFLADVTWQASDASIVESLVSVGHSLGKTVVAEGVETLEQLDFLKDVGCDTAQGFFINRPMPAADIPPWFEQWQSSRLSCAG